MKLIGLLLAVTSAALGGEYAILTSGARLYAERHERDGSKIRLFSKTGHTEIDAEQVVHFEMEEYVPPASVPARAPLPVAEPKAEMPADMQVLIAQAADNHGLPREFVQSVVAAESAYKTDAVSSKGAIGLMQLMPGTARELGADPRDPQQNVDAGTRYLRELLVKYGHHPELALAAYNAGPGAVDRYRGIPPYRETRTYVQRVLKKYNNLKKN